MTDSNEDKRPIILHRNSQTALKYDQDNREEAIPTSFNYKVEACKGNFMPAILKLERKEANVNDITSLDTGNTLLHLAVHYSFYNVIRTLIEAFKADVNARNASYQTPLHLNCKSLQRDIITFAYLMNNPSINIEAEDQSGLRAIDYAVINNFNAAFLFLIAKGTDLIKADQMGNGLIYYALINDNKFAVSFLYSHLPIYSINAAFYDQQASLADVLITNKNTSICKFICKYYYDNIEQERIESCVKFIADFPFYNRFSYEVMNTMLFYKQGRPGFFFNGLFPIACCCLRRKTKADRHNGNSNGNRLDTSVNREIYFTKQAINRDICYVNRAYNLRLYLYYWRQQHPRAYLCMLFFYIIDLFVVKAVITWDRFYWFSISAYIVILVLNVISCFGMFFNWHHSSMFIKEKHSLKDSTHNVFNSLLPILQNSKVDQFPKEETICEICLTEKDRTTNHCRICKKCVKQLYFHSSIFNRCLNRTNSYLYILFLLSMLLAHGSYITTLWGKYYSIPLQNYSFITVLIIGLITTNPVIAIVMLYMAVICVISLGKIMILLICLGTNVPYYNMFRYHKKNLGEIQPRQALYVGVPQVNTNSSKAFCKNLFIPKQNEALDIIN